MKKDAAGGAARQTRILQIMISNLCNMTYKKFCSLNKFTQIDITLAQGVPVGIRMEDELFWKLFHLGAFYVELLYSADHLEVYAIVHSDKDELLAPYLTCIDISALFTK